MKKKPDSSTIFAYKHRKSLCWKCTCVYRFTSTHINKSVVRAGVAANDAEMVKRTKHRSLTDCYQFEAVANEAKGRYSDGNKNLVHDMGRRLIETTCDQREIFWLMQRLILAAWHFCFHSLLRKRKTNFFWKLKIFQSLLRDLNGSAS